MSYEYRCIPAAIGVQTGVNVTRAASDVMARTLAQQMTEGFEFMGTYPVDTTESPGCLGGLLGARTVYRQISIMVFRRTVA